MIAVVGSLNLDVVLRMQRFPRPGETILSEEMSYYAGGKGANQAIAAARLGADVALFGAIGRDETGERLLEGLRVEGVDVRCVQIVDDAPTGTATIWVDATGENAIAVASGANGRFGIDAIDAARDQLARADVLLVQFEIPLETVAHLLAVLPEDGPTVIVNPAPARPLDATAMRLDRIDILTPNTSELKAITGADDRQRAAGRLLDLGVRNVVCTLGADGAAWLRRGAAQVRVPAPRVEVVDTTGAGDAFNGALAWALQDEPIEEAVRWAVAAGAAAATRRGAQASLPRRDEAAVLRRRTGPDHS